MVDSPSIGTKVLAVNGNFSYGALPPTLGNGTYSVLDVAKPEIFTQTYDPVGGGSDG